MALPPGASGSAVTGPQINTGEKLCKARFASLITLCPPLRDASFPPGPPIENMTRRNGCARFAGADHSLFLDKALRRRVCAGTHAVQSR